MRNINPLPFVATVCARLGHHARDLSVTRKVLLVVGALIAFQLVLIGYLLVNSERSYRTITIVREQRLEPLDDLKEVSDAYAYGVVNVAQKVRGGNMSPASGIGAIDEARASADKHWAAYLRAPDAASESDLVTRIETARQAADATADRLRQLLASGAVDQLDFFVTGGLYSSGSDPPPRPGEG